MNTKTRKGLGTVASLLIGISAASPALATNTGAQSLGVGNHRVDTWTFVCPIGTFSARADVSDIAPFDLFNTVGVALGKVGFGSSVVADLNPLISLGEGGGSSPNIQVNGGAGLYAMTFSKSLIGGEGYSGNATCRNFFGFIIANPGLTRQINL